jgi:hypothetical protein
MPERASSHTPWASDRGDGIVSDAEVAERLAAGTLHRFHAARLHTRPAVLEALRQNVRAWRKPKLRQDQEAPVMPPPAGLRWPFDPGPPPP